MHISSNEETKILIEGYVERETAVAGKRVEDAETAINKEQDDMRNAEMAGLTTTKPETTFEEMLNAIIYSLSDHASSNHGEDEEGEDDDEEHPALGKLSKDDEPGWVMGRITKTEQYRMERPRQMQMKLDELTQAGWGHAVDNISERDKKYGTTELNVLEGIEPATPDDAAASAPTTVGMPEETLDSVPGGLHMLRVTR